MATNNAGKLREARAIAGDKLEILSLSDIGYNHDIPETADTLEGNALIKVRAIKDVCDLDVFADDTGLMVDALGGAPGVYSARYAGEGCTPDDNIELMLKNMDGVEDRHARFRTCIALSINGEEHIFEGGVEGHIATGRSGSHGFGYDPIFISEETGKCFAEMTDDEKNAISHRGRAITAMMKWLSALCVVLFAFLPTNAAISSDWQLFNTFDDKIENVFDTADKAYILANAQLYNEYFPDSSVKLNFLFCLDKETDELRQYNAQNFLSGSVIRIANYNAIKKYLFIVYDDLMIDILYDDGRVFSIPALKNFSTSSTKEVRSISFDPEKNRVYLATDFGYVAINDEKHEVASSGIYNIPVDYAMRMADAFLLVSDGKIFRDSANSNHISFSDFKEVDWTEGEPLLKMAVLSSNKCVLSRKRNGWEYHYLLSFTEGTPDPESTYLGSFKDASFAENKNGLLMTRASQILQIDRETGERTLFTRRASGEDDEVPAGSWDLSEVIYVKPREGVYSMRMDNDNEWSITRQIVRPNSPSAFRSNSLGYSHKHGMIVNTHGIDQNFGSHLVANPVLLCAYRSGDWTQMGIPYFDNQQQARFINPCGFAQDPDNPDMFYFGSVTNGLIRYDVNDYDGSVLHFTRSNDSPSMKGHISVREPYTAWGSVMMSLNPRFDKNGNLLIAHCNTEVKDNYKSELWIWTPEKRKATISPETFQPFKILKVEGVTYSKSMLALPLETASDIVPFMIFSSYQEPFVVYDHNGTPEDESDDRQVVVRSLFDEDGSVSYNYLYCAIEDPSTGLVWVGSDNGVFTFDPKEQFSNAGKVNRIKVSRNDGTSLADYLFNGISINNITIDNRGRKWFSLNGGGVVCTSSDGRTIIQEITTENSMLPSDKVYATCFNPDSNSMMVATENGLCEYYLSQQVSSSSDSKARVYPNPVRHDYYGWVTIDGLEEDCLVKITDSAGNLVRELGPASGGSVQWDACNANLDRVASGVYFVLASSAPNGSSYSEVAKVLVIKN